MTRPPAMNAPTHDCPGCATVQVAQHLVACAECWWLLPNELRDAVNTTWRARRANRADVAAALAHRVALTRALAWYRENPAAGR